MTIDHRRWACREAELSWTAPQHVVILMERGATAKTHIRSSSTLTYEGCDRPGSISFVPAGVERQGYFRDADLVYTALWIDTALDFPGCPRLAELPMRINSGDGVIHSLLAALSAEMAGGHVPETSYIEHLVALFLEEPDPMANALGVKELGELGVCGAGAAVANAVYTATGLRVREFPLILDKLLPGLAALDG